MFLVIGHCVYMYVQSHGRTLV